MYVTLTFDEDGLHATGTPALRWLSESNPAEYTRVLGVLDAELRKYADQIARVRGLVVRATEHHDAAREQAARERRAAGRS